jgi:nucleoside-diphosphate-sugar epimerase
MTVLVTGSNGFIGSLLVSRLLAGGDRVRALVRDPGRKRRWPDKRAEISIGDLLDRDSLVRACTGADVVLHTAALVNHWAAWDAYWRTNVEGAANLLSAMQAAGVTRLIHFSTYHVYGKRPGVRAEDDPCQNAGDGYVDSKIAAEELIRREADKHGIVWTILRPANVYGPNDYTWMPMVARNIARRRMRLFGSEPCPAAVVYGDDVAAFAVASIRHAAAYGESFNVASPEPVTWTQFFQTFASCLGTTFPSMRIPYGLAFPLAYALEHTWRMAKAAHPPPITRFGVDLLSSDWRCDVSKARDRIGFTAETRHKQGLERTAQWLRDEGLVE